MYALEKVIAGGLQVIGPYSIECRSREKLSSQ
jgi:hypothetical protein